MSELDSLRPVPVSSRSLAAVIKSHALLLFGLLGSMWAEEVVDLLPGLQLDQFGIQPRTVHGLWGILFAPLLHADFQHLLANSLSFIILGGLVLLGGLRIFWNVTIFVTLTGGLGVWLLAPAHTVHIGASGLVFGYLGFLLARGYFARSVPWMLLAVALLAGYGGLLFGLFPGRPGISWQSHLFGFLAGLAAARLLRPEPPVRA